jgi:hypothetical protein
MAAESSWMQIGTALRPFASNSSFAGLSTLRV